MIATAGLGEKNARIYDADSGSEIYRLDVMEDRVTSVVFSPDGKKIVTTGLKGNSTRIWDLEALLRPQPAVSDF
jgi:WD40 repeat protein